MGSLVVGAEEGQRCTFGAGEVVVKAMPAQTGFAAFAVETAPPGFATPYHVHHRDDGVFYLIEGSLRIRCDGVDTIAHAGAMIFLPRGVPHAFRVEGDSAARWFNVQAPHGDFMLLAMAGPGAEPPAIEQVGPPPF